MWKLRQRPLALVLALLWSVDYVSAVARSKSLGWGYIVHTDC